MAVYQWLAIVPVVITWIFPQPRHLKPLALTSVGLMAASTAAVAVTLWNGAPAAVSTWMVVATAPCSGLPTQSSSRRSGTSCGGVCRRRGGLALGFIFSVGPLFACAGAVLQDALFQGRLLRGFSFGLQFPDNYTALFAGFAPILLGGMVLVAAFRIPIIPEPLPDNRRVPNEFLAELLREVRVGLRQFVLNRPVLMAVVIYIVVASGGNAILSNVSMHAKDVLGATTETVGLQMFLRFGFKAVAGGLLGWFLAKTEPRATLLATTFLLLLGMGWALASSGWWYMAPFGLLARGSCTGRIFRTMLRQPPRNRLFAPTLPTGTSSVCSSVSHRSRSA